MQINNFIKTNSYKSNHKNLTISVNNLWFYIGKYFPIIKNHKSIYLIIAIFILSFS